MTPDGPIPSFTPIGVVRTPFVERRDAPRQPYAAKDAPGTIELLPGRHFDDALRDLHRWTHLWLLYWFHRNEGWRPAVLPPRSPKGRRGVFATRSPHRPNAIGMSVLRIARVEGLRVDVLGVDMLDGTPVLDIKPYVPFADAIADAGGGWIGGDPDEPWTLLRSPLCDAQLAWLDAQGAPLWDAIEATLSLGPHPHAYRRIRREGPHGTLSLKDWRVVFREEGRSLHVERIDTGYRPQQLVTGEAPALHAAFAERFPQMAGARR